LSIVGLAAGRRLEAQVQLSPCLEKALLVMGRWKAWLRRWKVWLREGGVGEGDSDEHVRF
jgi:hypothetical protein